MKVRDKVLEKEPETQDVQLREVEYNQLMGMNFARNNIVQFVDSMISSYLHSIAVDRLQYDEGKNLQFEVDFEKGNKILKITEVGENLFTPDSK